MVGFGLPSTREPPTAKHPAIEEARASQSILETLETRLGRPGAAKSLVARLLGFVIAPDTLETCARLRPRRPSIDVL